MLLAIDAGNTNIVIGIHNGSSWVQRWRIRSVPDKMPDEYASLVRSLLLEQAVDPDAIERAVLGSVVPPLTGTLSELVVQLIRKAPLVISPGVKTGIRIRTDNPVEMGSDLVANAVAAYDHFKSSCIAVDFGTALTFTAVAEPGDLCGVAIAPGLKSAAEALSVRASQLPRVQLAEPPTAIGRNTAHSIQSGIVFGYAGLVKELIDRMRAELGPATRAIATGGLAEVIAPITGYFAAVEPWLTLEGLRLIAGRN